MREKLLFELSASNASRAATNWSRY